MRRIAGVSGAVMAALAFGARAGEGMWTFDNFPADRVRAEHRVDITDRWLERVRSSVVRLANCTGSFVSPEGLILTNHHCVASCLAEHSSREESLIETGFHARARDEERRCGTQVADVLAEIEEITPAVEEALRGLDALAANERRKQTLTTLEQRCEDDSGLKCEAVTLYNGGQYFLYKYRRYDDVRIVFAPEAGIAAFGGDPDNFQFPRWCLDMAFLRAYDNGAPARIENHLDVDFAGPAEGELVLVAGHPGSTDRLLTVAELRTTRDVELPRWLLRAAELRGRYSQFGKQSEAAERIVRDPLNGLENQIKVRRKLLDALHNDEMLAAKARDERELRARSAEVPELGTGFGDPWRRIEQAQAVMRAIEAPYTFLEGGAGFNSRLFRYARALVRAAEERLKPSTERLREYVDTDLPRIEQQLAAAVPVYPELERLTLSFSLERMREWLGPDHETVRELLAMESPDSLAARLVEGSSLADPDARMALWRGGAAATEASDDPMIELARMVDDEARAIRKRYEDEVEAPVDQAHEAIARARFALYGTEVYPDATFTLRLNYGTVQGWVEDGTPVPPFTELERLFERATGQPPFAVPETWLAARGNLDLGTRFNLASVNDIVGGNSGSPLLDASGNIVGLIFDGNIHAISGTYWFDPELNRAVSVHTAIMREALEKVYAAEELLRELDAT